MKVSKLGALVGLSTALILGPVTAAQAQKPGFYLGAEVGVYNVDEGNVNENDRVLKGYVGGQFTNWFAVEGSWTDFNRIDSGGDTFKADGAGLSAVFSLPMGSTSSLFVKAGQFWWDSDSVLGGTPGTSDGSDPFWGVGGKMGFSDHLALRLEVERYDVADIDIYTLMGGLEYKF